MSSDQAKSPPEQPAQPAAVPAYPPQYSGAHYPQLPPGAYPPPYYTYTPLANDPNHDPNAPNGPPMPYLMAFPPPPPGMVYAYAPPPPVPGQGMPYPYPPPQGLPAAPRPKRKQVKMACTNCAGACKRCDDSRPCERCVKYGIADTCVDGTRKERKKGIKRGPYKRKSKFGSNEAAFPTASSAPTGEASTEPTTTPAPTYPPMPESYYPYYYPHPGYPAPGHEVPQPNGEAVANGNGHPMPHPYYPLHPAVYPSYPPYSHPGPVAYAAPPAMMPPPPPPPDVNGKADDTVTAAPKSKKKRKVGEDGAPKAKKAKATNGEITNGVGPTAVGSSHTNGTAVNGVNGAADQRHVVSSA